MQIRAWIMLILGVVGLGYGVYYLFVLIPRMEQFGYLMNIAFDPVSHYIFVGVVLLVAGGLVWWGWKRLKYQRPLGL